MHHDKASSAGQHPQPSLWKAGLAGAAAGLAAAAAMDAFQAVLARLSPPESDAGSATEQAADALSVIVTGLPLAEDMRPAAGQTVHYVLGAALGIGYAIAAEYKPEAAAGFGTAFGSSVAAVLDEAAVPLAGLGPTPAQTPPATHLYTLSSHLVFGIAAEATRRIARRTLG